MNNTKDVRIIEAGNGFPSHGHMVTLDGECYIVVECGSNIITSRRGNYIVASLRDATDDEFREMEIFPCKCRLID